MEQSVGFTQVELGLVEGVGSACRITPDTERFRADLELRIMASAAHGSPLNHHLTVAAIWVTTVHL